MDLTDEPTIKTSKREKTWTHQLRYFSSCSRTEGFWGIRDGCSWKLVSPSQPPSLRLPLSSSWNQSWIPSKPRRLSALINPPQNQSRIWPDWSVEHRSYFHPKTHPRVITFFASPIQMFGCYCPVWSSSSAYAWLPGPITHTGDG